MAWTCTEAESMSKKANARATIQFSDNFFCDSFINIRSLSPSASRSILSINLFFKLLHSKTSFGRMTTQILVYVILPLSGVWWKQNSYSVVKLRETQGHSKKFIPTSIFFFAVGLNVHASASMGPAAEWESHACVSWRGFKKKKKTAQRPWRTYEYLLRMWRFFVFNYCCLPNDFYSLCWKWSLMHGAWIPLISFLSRRDERRPFILAGSSTNCLLTLYVYSSTEFSAAEFPATCQLLLSNAYCFHVLGCPIFRHSPHAYTFAFYIVTLYLRADG